jgi:pyruvate formate lyase activating enzyme
MAEGMIFDIEHYAVHDGPGIRTVVFFKGCPLKCLWCCNPESQGLHAELRYAASRCHSCYGCALACPSGAVDKGADGPVFDRRPCRSCPDWPCVEACSNGALAKIGRRVKAEEVASRVAADMAFYRNSGGGATFSGGEPFMQPEFLEELLLRCRAKGIHTAVETCGYVPTQTLLRLEPLVGLFLYDVKVLDPHLHVRYTGVSNEAILENLRRLAERDASKVTVRVPLVPGCTDSKENLAGVATLARELGIHTVQIMPYHELGRDKYEGLGREYPITVEGPIAWPANLEAALRVFTERGLTCEIGGE